MKFFLISCLLAISANAVLGRNLAENGFRRYPRDVDLTGMRVKGNTVTQDGVTDARGVNLKDNNIQQEQGPLIGNLPKTSGENTANTSGENTANTSGENTFNTSGQHIANNLGENTANTSGENSATSQNVSGISGEHSSENTNDISPDYIIEPFPIPDSQCKSDNGY